MTMRKISSAFAMIVMMFSTILFLAMGQVQMAESQTVLFEADFDKKAVPDASVNKPESWTAQSVDKLSKFSIKDGTLIDESDGCGNSTLTLLPDPKGSNKDWTHYTVSMDVSWSDNDNLAIIFRYTDPKSFYAFILSASEALQKYWLVPGPDGTGTKICLDVAAADKAALATGPHGETIKEGANAGGKITAIGGWYTAKVEAFGETINLYFGPQGKPKLLKSVKDKKFTKGTVGIWRGSDPGGLDNVSVISPPPGTAVEPKSKLATSWGNIKVAY